MVPQERVRVIVVHLVDRRALSWGEDIMEPLGAFVVPERLSAPDGYTMLVEGVQTMLRSSPFLLFDGNCAKAMTFYLACLGGELTLTTLGETPMKESFPPEKHERIINAHLKSGFIELSATDWMAAPAYEPRYGDIFAIFVLGDGYEELKAVFDKLSDGAQPDRFQELHDPPFGTYGQFFDKYGYQWIIKGDKKA